MSVAGLACAADLATVPSIAMLVVAECAHLAPLAQGHFDDVTKIYFKKVRANVQARVVQSPPPWQ